MEEPIDCNKSDTQMSESPKVWTELKPNCAHIQSSSDEQSVQQMATDSNEERVDVSPPEGLISQLLPQLHCLESGDGTDYSVMAVLQSDESSKRQYNPSVESRQLHNHKERLRRSRMKCSCDALRALVPGLTDKTDKATVLEHTVAFLFHLSKCCGVKCDDYLPTYPPPMSAKLLELYPTLMSGEYQYYESIPSADPDFVGAPNESHIVEVCESNGTQYVITSDGSQYMVIDATEGQQTVATTEEQSPQQSIDMIVDDLTVDQSVPQMGSKDESKDESMEPTPDECRKCMSQVIDMLSDNKENIDPNTDPNAKPVRKKRSYRRRVKTEDIHSQSPSPQIDSTLSKVRKQRKLRNMSKND